MVKLRELSENDIEPIAYIYNYHVVNTTVVFETNPFSIEKMRGTVIEISRRFPFVVAEENGELVGFAYVHTWKSKPLYDSTVESTLYVREDCKSKGIGSLLLGELIDRCRKQGIHAIIACITAENHESECFHLKHGFTKVSYFSQVGRKFGRWLDIVDYELILD